MNAGRFRDFAFVCPHLADTKLEQFAPESNAALLIRMGCSEQQEHPNGGPFRVFEVGVAQQTPVEFDPSVSHVADLHRSSS